jgi:hypothetical protein
MNGHSGTMAQTGHFSWPGITSPKLLPTTSMGLGAPLNASPGRVKRRSQGTSGVPASPRAHHLLRALTPPISPRSGANRDSNRYIFRSVASLPAAAFISLVHDLLAVQVGGKVGGDDEHRESNAGNGGEPGRNIKALSPWSNQASCRSG